jgi:hypothetical protein
MHHWKFSFFVCEVLCRACDDYVHNLVARQADAHTQHVIRFWRINSVLQEFFFLRTVKNGKSRYGRETRRYLSCKHMLYLTRFLVSTQRSDLLAVRTEIPVIPLW